GLAEPGREWAGRDGGWPRVGERGRQSAPRPEGGCGRGGEGRGGEGRGGEGRGGEGADRRCGPSRTVTAAEGRER
ncbi:unnamed protein product, partial [Bubo scandiacus]